MMKDPFPKQEFNQIEKCIEEAWGELVLERWESAAALIKPLLEEYPDLEEAAQVNAACCYYLALQVYEQTHDLDETRKLLDQGFKYAPGHPKLKEAQGAILNAEGVKEADRADLLWKQGDWSAAREPLTGACRLLQSAHKADSGVGAIKDNLANIRQRGEALLENEFSSDRREADELFDKAAQIGDQATAALYEQNFHQVLVLYGELLKLLSKARSLNPFNETISDNYLAALEMIWGISSYLEEEEDAQNPAVGKSLESNINYELLDYALKTRDAQLLNLAMWNQYLKKMK
ncbi:MAG: hypothetical protein ABFD04_01015 [Syntrophomonas sp.]